MSDRTSMPAGKGLAIARNIGEIVVIDETISIVVEEIYGKTVKLRIRAPLDMHIARPDGVRNRILKEKRAEEQMVLHLPM